MKYLVAILILFWGLPGRLWANNELSLVPSADMPTLSIDGVEAIDLRLVGNGNLVSFDLYFNNIDFVFSGCEFVIYIPQMMTRFSNDELDWQTNTGAVFVPGPAFQTGKGLALPTYADGTRMKPDYLYTLTAPTLGLVFTDPMARWYGSTAEPHPGGLLGTIKVRYNQNGAVNCTSRLESVQIGLGPTYNNGEFDYFSDDRGMRIRLVTTPPTDLNGQYGLPGYVANPDVALKADADRNNLRNSLDAMPAVYCSLNGPNDPSCLNRNYWSQHLDQFRQVFDFNCDGQVNGIDALGNARLGLQKRSFLYLDGNGNFFMPEAYQNDLGVLAFRVYSRSSKTITPYLSKADGLYWRLLWEDAGNQVHLLLVHNQRYQDAVYPQVLWKGATEQTLPAAAYIRHYDAANQAKDYPAQ